MDYEVETILFDDPSVGIDTVQADDIVLARIDQIHAHLRAKVNDGDWDRIGVNVNRKAHTVTDTFVFRHSQDASLFKLFFG